MAGDYCNEIISVFLQRNVNELSDDDLRTAIQTKDRSYSTEKIRRILQTYPSLFQLQYNKEDTFLVRIECRINICQDFLAGKCSFKTRGCNQLHLCRSFGHCVKKNCRFPHDFTRGDNRRIIEQSKCQNVDPLLLVHLIQFNNRFPKCTYETPVPSSVVSTPTDMISSSVQPKPARRTFERSNSTGSRRASGGCMLDRITDQDDLIQSISTLDTNPQIKISVRTKSITPNVTIEMIEFFLRRRGLSVEKRLDSKADENFHQWTLQLKENNAIRDLLRISVIPYNGILLKFKRMNPIIDSKSFVLKSAIDANRGPITTEEFSTYINQLIERNSYKSTDLSLPSEQILLVQCEKIIDFNRLERVQRSRRQLQGTDVSLKRIYELDKMLIESILTPLSFPVLERIIESVHENVFTFTVESKQRALVEFIHTDALKQWLEVTDITKHKFGVDIKPSIEYVDEDKSSNTSCQSFATRPAQQKADNTTSQVAINLSQSWAMVVNHPTFSIEYKNYIRSELGFEIEIHGDRVEIHGSPISDTLTKEKSYAALKNRTNNFMHRFAFRPIVLDQPVEQLDILHAHSKTVAFYPTEDDNYILATKKTNMESIRHKLLSKTSIDHKKNEKINEVSSVAYSKPNKLSAIANQRELIVENLPRPDESTQTRSITFYVDEPGFEILINEDLNQLLAVIKSKCSLEKQIIHRQIHIQIPKANLDQLDDNTFEFLLQENDSEPPADSTKVSETPKKNWLSTIFPWNKPKTQSPQQTPTPQVQSISNANNTQYVSVGSSKIIICTGDLTEQVVDIIVVCSTSILLCNAITSAAGQEVQDVYNQQVSHGTLAFATIGGHLPCKRIVFRPWNCDKNHLQDLKQSIDEFIAPIIRYAVQENFTTIAFPSVGCGQLGHNPKLIAEYMIGETYQQLKTAVHSQLTVSFVLLSQQQNVYDAFADQLNTIESLKAIPTSIPFDKQIVKITLTGVNESESNECQNKIKELARSCSFKRHLTDKIDIADWCQNSIDKYYDYCLKRRVIPTLDIQNANVDLIGPKEAVLEAEKYYFELTTEILRNARIQILSRGFVWLVEVLPGKWEQYSDKIIRQIEDAQSKNLAHIEFTNEKLERCRVIFSSMEEQYQTRKRKVCRKRIDSTFPNNWDAFSDNFKRTVLSDSSKEYKDIYDRFDKTMKGNYSKIAKIERIQNKRWYKQYAAHRDDFTQRYDQPNERLLFHGCSSTSADKIVQEGFNRSFAGMNGVLYGEGVYFHQHAKYSSNYTKSDVSNDRTMFLARVLIGNTCIGTPSMKVPPKGYDTTTDGLHIFVVYHDAGAYGEYLITYR